MKAKKRSYTTVSIRKQDLRKLRKLCYEMSLERGERVTQKELISELLERKLWWRERAKR